MDQDRSHLTFGRYLQSIRRAKGIELTAVAAATRISPGILALIEAEDHDQLPAEVFVRGFLRAYARQIGVDGDDVLARYLADRSEVSSGEQADAPVAGGSARFWLRLLLVLLGLAAIMVVTLRVILPPEPGSSAPAPEAAERQPAPPLSEPSPKPSPEPPAEDPSDAAADPLTSGNQPAGVMNAEPVAVPPASGPSSPRAHTLQVQTLAPTWIKIIVDRAAPVEYSLKAGDRLDFEARSGFHLLVGNAAGIALMLDGEPVAAEGGEGQVVSLTLP